MSNAYTLLWIAEKFFCVNRFNYIHEDFPPKHRKPRQKCSDVRPHHATSCPRARMPFMLSRVTFPLTRHMENILLYQNLAFACL